MAVFLDGCFWHGCPVHYTAPVSNEAFWARKVRTNRERDLETTRSLEAAGWTVIRVWEHEDPEAAAKRIQRVVGERTAPRVSGSQAGLSGEPGQASPPSGHTADRARDGLPPLGGDQRRRQGRVVE